MKNIPTLMAIFFGLISIACYQIGKHLPGREIPPLSELSLHNLPSGSIYAIGQDFVMGEPNAVSNALVNGLPKGWYLLCDGKGNFTTQAEKYRMIGIPDYNDCQWMIRTNRFEAIAAAWRMKGITDATYVEEQNHIKFRPPNMGIKFQECKETN